jgi:hypothetical protein
MHLQAGSLQYLQGLVPTSAGLPACAGSLLDSENEPPIQELVHPTNPSDLRYNNQ